jgi:hypothetical protein
LISMTGTEGSVFLANGISFVFIIVSLFFARTRFKVAGEAKPSQSVSSEFKEGLAYISKSTIVLSAILMSSLLGFFGIPLLQQIPAVARDILQTALDTETIIAARTSTLYTAQGVGAVIAAFMMTYFSTTDKNKMLLWGQILFIAPIVTLGMVTNHMLALGLLAFIGWGTVTQLISMNTMIQIRVPNELRGRVFSVYFWALQGVAPFGSIVIGWIAQTWDVPTAIVTGGLVCFVGIALVRLFFARNEAKTA